MRTTWRTSLCLLTLLWLSPAVTTAAPAHPSCADDAECDRLANAAREFSKAGRFDDAQRSYEEAFQRRSDPMLLFNLARVLHKAGRPAIAVIYYQKFLGSRPDLTAEERRKSEGYLKSAQEEAAAASAPSTPTPATRATTPAATPAATPDTPQSLTTTTPAEQPRDTVPLYKKWWLWTIVGGAVGITVIGLAAGLAPHRPDVTGLPATHPFGD